MGNFFCIGNGKSRKGLNLDYFKKHGTVVGCNALYREYKPDILVSNDIDISHEIYRSGYCEYNTTYLTDWYILPTESLEGFIIEVEHGVYCPNLNMVFKEELHKDFVINGEKDQTFITGVTPTDRVVNIDNDLQLSAGILSVNIVTKLIDMPFGDVSDVYLIGHDLYSNDDKYNNIYADTNCYASNEDNAVDCKNWISQLKQTFDNNPEINFYKVNKNDFETSEWPNHRQKTDSIIEEWNDCSNLHYITQNKLMKKLDKS